MLGDAIFDNNEKSFSFLFLLSQKEVGVGLFQLGFFRIVSTSFKDIVSTMFSKREIKLVFVLKEWDEEKERTFIKIKTQSFSLSCHLEKNKHDVFKRAMMLRYWNDIKILLDFPSIFLILLFQVKLFLFVIK